MILCSDYKDGSFKNVDIVHEINALNILGYKSYTNGKSFPKVY